MLRLIATGLLTIAALLAVTLALPVEAWRRGEPRGPRLEATATVPRWPRPLRLWVDTDAACGHGPRTDPDDCLAILLLARSPEVEIAGVSTVFGNAPLEVTDSITRALVGQLSANDSASPAVVRGAAGPMAESVHAGSRAGKAPAHVALAGALQNGPLVILALGPLTNLATVLLNRPDLRSRVMGIVAVVGRRRGHLFHPVEGGTAPSFLGHGPVFRDFNFAKDEAAASALLEMRLPLTLIPYESAREVQVSGADLERMVAIGGAAGWVGSRAGGWLEYWERDIGRDGFYPFDLVAAGYVVRPELVGCASVSAWVGPDAGLLGWLGRRGLFAGPKPTSKREAVAPARYCPDVEENADSWLLARLTDRRRIGTTVSPQ